MATVKGFFGHAQRPLREGLRKKGQVRAQVEVVEARAILDVVFMIDTGAFGAILLDRDFLRVVHALGYRGGISSPVLPWITSRPDFFEALGFAKGLTVTGKMGPVYRLRFAALRLCNPDGRAPARARWLRPVYGGFSYPFVRGDAGAPTVSLLGREILNQIGEVRWCGPASVIQLKGV